MDDERLANCHPGRHVYNRLLSHLVSLVVTSSSSSPSSKFISLRCAIPSILLAGTRLEPAHETDSPVAYQGITFTSNSASLYPSYPSSTKSRRDKQQCRNLSLSLSSS